MAGPFCALAELRSLSKGRWEVGDACELAITPDREADGDENRTTGSTDLHRDKTTYAGTIRFLGEAAIGSGGDEQARAMWVGVELSAPAGRNDGSVPTPANMLCLSGSLWLSLALSGSLALWLSLCLSLCVRARFLQIAGCTGTRRAIL
jgi:hypothetical protein